MKNILKYIFSLALAGGLLWYTLKDYDFSGNIEKLSQVNWYWVFVSAVFTLLAHLSRAIRWKMLLKPLGYMPSTFHATMAVFMGYFANYLLPRLGEVTRCGTLNSTEDIPIEKSFGTVVTERLLDVVMVLLIFALNFLLEFNRLSEYFLGFFNKKSAQPTGPNYSLYIIIGLIAVLAFIIYRFKSNILASSIGQKILKLLSGFTEGIMSIFKLERPWAFIGHTLFVWFCYYMSTYVAFFAMPETSRLGPVAALSTLTTGALGVAAPTPGGLGAYHALVSSLLTMYGLSTDSGKTLAIFLHGTQMLFTIIFGVFALIVLFMRRKAAK